MLTTIFKTPERLKILRTTVLKDKTTVTEISHETGVSKGLVSRYLDCLKEYGLLNREKNTYNVGEGPQIRIIKVLLNLEQLRWEDIKPEWALSAGLYGSWAAGTNHEDSDIDVWIKVEKYPSENELNSIYKKIKTNSISEVNLLILTPEKLEMIKNTDTPFFHSLLRNSLVLQGENLE